MLMSMPPPQAIATFNRNSTISGIYVLQFIGGDDVTLDHLAITGGTIGVLLTRRRDVMGPLVNRGLTTVVAGVIVLLLLLPLGIGVVMYSVNRDYMNVLLHDGFGQVLLIGAGLLAGVGFYWMKKIIEIDV